MTAKISDIAKLAGISSASVSRILNKTGRYSEETAKKVHKIAEEIGYYKDISASNLASQKSSTIGIIYTTLNTNFSNIVVDAIVSTATMNHFDTIMMQSKKDDANDLDQVCQRMMERRVFSILFVSIRPTAKTIQLLNNLGIVSLLVGTASPLSTPYISSNDYQIGFQATQFLLDRGYQKIGFAGADTTTDFVRRQRYSGYLAALKQASVRFSQDWKFDGDFSYDAGIQAATYYCHHQDLHAIIAASDEVSWGMLNGFQDRGVNVPEQIAILSIDGTDSCLRTRPKLSSVTQNFELMGKTAIEYLLQSPKNRKSKVFIPFRIDPRNTTR
ncbi:LacI family transcriptional regulator [Lentilactobacillus parafarraginis]|uniref:Transcriptional regulator, LacI family n=2 Tax=Lentilactobacillus parafarraginis TaxID=390842 RepID=A0A0R1YIV8_9LACO|nr:LacI family DNA-binding transcriptional regulator [Lentilactobacillus parafarraginis]KRM42416.1 transcriptional regulator, LacI family [Lentilactobacillus parafarraginis DSM 18390 = JCM 14109]TLQ17060.1 LacI family transcriptional regulator [Lentilactobacillus parafarraginis]